MHAITTRPKKYFSRYKKPLVEFPNLIEAQQKSFKWLVEQGIESISVNPDALIKTIIAVKKAESRH